MCALPSTDDDNEEREDETSFVGQRSGRVIRTLASGKILLSFLFVAVHLSCI